MGLLWNLDRRAEVGHHLVRVETAHIVAWRRPLAHHDHGNRFVAIDGADIDIVIEWIAPERSPAAPPTTAVEPPRRPPETDRQSGMSEKSVSVGLHHGGRRISKKKNTVQKTQTDTTKHQPHEQ